MRPTRRLLLVTLTSTIVAAAVMVAAAFWSAQLALNRSAAVAGTQHQLRFTLRALDSAAQAQNPGFEPVSAQTGYTCGAFFAGDLYLAGRGGLSIYAPDGTLRRTLRTGIELPVAPIVAIASGRLRGSTDAQLLLATSGAGLLFLEPNAGGTTVLHQLLPESSDAADLTSLLVLPTGDLLLGTRHAGVLGFNGAKLVPLEGTAKAREITALAAVDSASYLIATRNAGVFYVHAGTVQQADASSGMPDNQVDALAVANGKAFAGTPLGSAEFDLSGEAFKPSRTLAAGLFSHALAATSSELLIGSFDQGVQQISLDAHPRLRNAAFSGTGAESGQRIDQFLSAGTSEPLYALSDGQLLARTSYGWRSVLPAASPTLADRNISALAFAPDGALYVGFFDHGLDIVPADHGPIRHVEDDHLFCINRLALDPHRETIAAATANGLVLFDREGAPRQTLTRRDGLISDHVTDIAFTRSGITLATPAGLTFLTPSGAESLYAFQGLVNNHVYTLGSGGGNDSLLAGTLGGISVLKGSAVQRNLTVANSGLKHNWITALTAAPGGGWLVGTYGGGVMTLSAEGDRFVPIEFPAGSPRDLVVNPNALLVTRNRVYAGTLGHGMLVEDLRSNRWSVVTSGLPSLNVTAFAERDGELYVGTENGLVRIAEEKLAGGLQ